MLKKKNTKTKKLHRQKKLKKYNKKTIKGGIFGLGVKVGPNDGNANPSFFQKLTSRKINPTQSENLKESETTKEQIYEGNLAYGNPQSVNENGEETQIATPITNNIPNADARVNRVFVDDADVIAGCKTKEIYNKLNQLNKYLPDENIDYNKLINKVKYFRQDPEQYKFNGTSIFEYKKNGKTYKLHMTNIFELLDNILKIYNMDFLILRYYNSNYNDLDLDSKKIIKLYNYFYKTCNNMLSTIKQVSNFVVSSYNSDIYCEPNLLNAFKEFLFKEKVDENGNPKIIPKTKEELTFNEIQVKDENFNAKLNLWKDLIKLLLQEVTEYNKIINP